MTTFAGRIIRFCTGLEFTGPLPDGVSVMNPYRDNSNVIRVITQFYNKFYDDTNPRHLILGINPGRFGAGVTGIPFTDTKRLREKCNLEIKGIETHETSSVFVYEMIDAYGGPEKFYSRFYIGAVSPLGFTAKNNKGKELNCNYYDSKMLQESVSDFILENMKKQIDLGILRDVCFCLGTGKNFKFLSRLNDTFHFFDRIEPLEHPRYIMQYKSGKRHYYIKLYLEKLGML